MAGDLPVQQVGQGGHQQGHSGQDDPHPGAPVVEVVEQEGHGDAEEAEEIGEGENVVQREFVHTVAPI